MNVFVTLCSQIHLLTHSDTKTISIVQRTQKHRYHHFQTLKQTKKEKKAKTNVQARSGEDIGQGQDEKEEEEEGEEEEEDLNTVTSALLQEIESLHPPSR